MATAYRGCAMMDSPVPRSREYEICVASQLSNLADIGAFITERARLAGMEEQAVFDVQMAVDEACTNTMQHGYEGREDGELRICCFVEGRDFVVRITDQGKPFAPDDVVAPDLSKPLEMREAGGLGLFFMRQLMDTVEFRPVPEGGNELIMRKRRTASS